jgi:hypothetical protein
MQKPLHSLAAQMKDQFERRKAPMLVIALCMCSIGYSSGVTSIFAQESRDAWSNGTPNDSLSSAIEQRERMLNHTVTVRFPAATEDDVNVPEPVTISASEHPEWIEFDPQDFTFYFSNKMISQVLRGRKLIPVSERAVAINPVSNGMYEKAVMQGAPHEGFVYDHNKAVEDIVRAFRSAQDSVIVPVTYEEPTLVLSTADRDITLTSLSKGRSNFKGSALGRAANVRKAINERLHGIVISPGESFSFNETIVGSGYWHDALVIKNGKDLVAEPGGGICQATTTIFRAALLAGLPIEKRANHSLYVTYYKDYGVGLDATIYPGKQDFAFKNDTLHPIVIVGKTDGDDAYVELYGVPDGRTVALNGPFFASNGMEAGFKLATNQIAWKYDVTYPDGRTVSAPIKSTYLGMPKKLHEEFAQRAGMGILLGTANVVADVIAQR